MNEDKDALIVLFEHMDQLIQESGEGLTPRSIGIAASVAAEDAVRWGLVEGRLWDEDGPQLLADSYARVKGFTPEELLLDDLER